MVIDIIKINRVIQSSILIFLLSGLLFLESCSSNKKSNQIVEQKMELSCQLYDEEFEIDYKTIKYFSEEIKNYLEDNQKYDVLSIFIKGGNPQSSKLRRWYLSEDEKLFKVVQEYTNREEVELEKIPLDMNTLLLNSTSGNFLQICDYSSNNDTYIFLIKKGRDVTFKYSSTSRNYHVLSKLDKDKIRESINVLNVLEKIEN